MKTIFENCKNQFVGFELGTMLLDSKMGNSEKKNFFVKNPKRVLLSIPRIARTSMMVLLW